MVDSHICNFFSQLQIVNIEICTFISGIDLNLQGIRTGSHFDGQVHLCPLTVGSILRTVLLGKHRPIGAISNCIKTEHAVVGTVGSCTRFDIEPIAQVHSPCICGRLKGNGGGDHTAVCLICMRSIYTGMNRRMDQLNAAAAGRNTAVQGTVFKTAVGHQICTVEHHRDVVDIGSCAGICSIKLYLNNAGIGRNRNRYGFFVP